MSSNSILLLYEIRVLYSAKWKCSRFQLFSLKDTPFLAGFSKIICFILSHTMSLKARHGVSGILVKCCPSDYWSHLLPNFSWGPPAFMKGLFRHPGFWYSLEGFFDSIPTEYISWFGINLRLTFCWGIL